MNNFFSTGILLGLGFATGLVYKNFDRIKIEYDKQKSILYAENIVMEFFIDLLKKNKNISLNEAILKFEDKDKNYKNLEEFAKSKQRTVDSYTLAYSHIFKKAQIKNKLINDFFI